MKITLLRHGIAEEKLDGRCKTDDERPLTQEGIDKIRMIGKYLKNMGLKFDLVLTSTLIRAKETAEIASAELGIRNLIKETPHLKPEGRYADLLEVIAEEYPEARDVLLVGHEPFMSGFISMMLSGEENLMIQMKKGGLCRLDSRKLKPGKSELLWLMTPKHMTAMASSGFTSVSSRS